MATSRKSQGAKAANSRKSSGSGSAAKAARSKIVVERVQTGVRLEKKLLKVLKGLAEYHDISLGDLLEGIVLHVFEGKLPLGDESLQTVKRLKQVYGLNLDAGASHRLVEDRSR